MPDWAVTVIVLSACGLGTFVMLTLKAGKKASREGEEGPE